jgi:hypothetical protein
VRKIVQLVMVAGLALGSAFALALLSGSAVPTWAPAATAAIHPGDQTLNPSIPHWGGPVALASTGTSAGQRVYSYGNSSLRGGVTVLSPKTGISLGDAGTGWSHNVAAASPGIPGDSGSAFLDSTGRALGVLSTLQIVPVPASNGVGDLPHELAYLHAHGAINAQLALGTEPFTPSKPPLGV